MPPRSNRHLICFAVLLALSGAAIAQVNEFSAKVIGISDGVSPLETEAKAAKRGLWPDPDPVPPWKWRQQKKAAVSVR